jgi:hypothetical protein
MNFRSIYKRLKQFAKTPSGKKLLTWTQRLFLAVILIWLIYQLTGIGWGNVWRSLPTQFAFYLLFILMYFQLPLFEVLIYRVTWVFNSLKSIPIFLLKRVYNTDLLGYSGEVYFYIWARKNLLLEERDIFLIIKDNNIISSIASTIVAFVLLSLFLFTGQIKIIEWIIDQNQAYFWGGILATILIAFLFIKFRQFVITMTMRNAYKIFSIQMFRLTLLQTMNVLVYYVVIPDAPLHVWFTLISVEIILSRIPFLPNRDLIFVGMSIGMAEGLMVSQSEIAGLMVARAALGKIFGLLSFAIAHLARRSSVVAELEGKDKKELIEENTEGTNS